MTDVVPVFMRAALMEETGGSDVLTLRSVPVPTLGDDDILVEVQAVTVNRTLDLAVRTGTYVRKPALPHVLGVDPSGVVVSVGANVRSLQPGDRVALSSRVGRTADGKIVMLGVDCWGGYAQYVRAPATSAHAIPDGLPFATASIVMRHGPQAFHMLRAKANVRPGEWVLVMGAAGALGSASVQVARHLGARVIVAAGADERVAAALALGGEFGINYRRDNLTAQVMEITGGHGVGVVCENIGEPGLFEQAFDSLGRLGRLVSVGSHGGGGKVPLDIARLYMNQITIMGSTMTTAQDVDDSFQLAAEGGLEALVATTLPLNRAGEAHDLAADISTLGKVVLNPTLPC